MSNLPALKWDVEIGSIYFHSPSMRTSSINIWAIIGPEVDISWTSSATVSLFYGQSLIGEVALKDTFIVPERSALCIEDMRFEISDMIGLKTLFRDVMSTVKGPQQRGNGSPAAALEVVENGHKLLVSIDLNGVGSLKSSAPIVKLAGTEIEISFSIMSPNVVEIYFGQAHFELMKNGIELAKLTGELGIDIGSNEYVLKGEILSKSDLSGRAILKGVNLDDDTNTWFFHAIRQFEMEVDLDKMLVGREQLLLAEMNHS
ncbi:hypothetical protein TARUN_1249 [Trichoderma arundinaceum]|uniref:Uncharacterized protein n=1 Tax=Trichoderma arundinaceum TaxID=490622 RepID=A0A395NY15_TRIAR|nr:hypothetical protein TARUN_1249 [Trichoderma arundinaceum]